MLRKLLASAVLALIAVPGMAQVRRPGPPGPGAAGPGAPGPGKHRAVAVAGEWTGYITDSHCGMKGANKTHTAQCVESCMRGGSQPQILNEADNQFYGLDSFDKVKGLVGVRITVKGTLSSDGTKIAVASADKASSAKLP